MRTILLIAIAALLFSACSNNTPSKAIPGAGGAHLYDMMDEDSTEQKADTTEKSK